MKWEHAFEKKLGAIRKGVSIYATGKQVYDIGRVVIPMLL
jgi:hypothetical protein